MPGGCSGTLTVSRQRSFVPEPVKSKQCPHRSLVDDAGNALHRYGYYVRLRTDNAWKVPLVQGKRPPVPDESSSIKEKGMYALFLMLLFRPHRGPHDLVFRMLQNTRGAASEDEAWTHIHNAYQHWRRVEVDDVARPCLQHADTVSCSEPAFGAKPWWACVVYEKLRN